MQTSSPARGRAALALVAAAVTAGLLTGCTGPPSGTSAGGTSAGGTSAGGTSAGGTSAGGTSDGGTSDGGTPAGGTSAGGTAGGGATPGGTAGGGPAGSTGGKAGGARRGVAVPGAVVLRAGDWPGGKVRRTVTRVAGLAPTEPSACQERTAYPSDRHRLAARAVGISSDAPESGGVLQAVVRYAPGRAAQAMAEMRRVLAACHTHRLPDAGPPWTRTYVAEGERFAGDDALLVRQVDRQAGVDREWTRYITVVRVGDALLTTSSELGEGVADEAVARRLAAVGARRAACLRTTC